MTGSSRRSFLKTAAGAVPGAAALGSLGVGACAPEASDGSSGRASAPPLLPPETLRALAEVALPTEALGADGTESAVRGFEAWVEGFQAAAELDHPYLTGELRYGPPHPGPRWTAQLEAMDLESERRSGVRFADLPHEQRLRVVDHQVREEGSASLPGNPASANGVAVGLLAWFYQTSGANDLCYEAEVGRHVCRGTTSLPDEPGPVRSG